MVGHRLLLVVVRGWSSFVAERRCGWYSRLGWTLLWLVIVVGLLGGSLFVDGRRLLLLVVVVARSCSCG